MPIPPWSTRTAGSAGLALLVRPEVRVGDWVIVGAGTVLRRIAADDAAELINALHSATALPPPLTVDPFDEAAPPEAAGGAP